jgi:transcriptional regulator with XRE-family HTH domain
MKRETTAKRLNKIMKDRALRQVDILNLAAPYCEQYEVKMNKSDISQYCSGKTEPNQDKLFILGLALNVNESWLMGLDVPMDRLIFRDTPGESDIDFDSFKKSYDQSNFRRNRLKNQIVENMDKINNDGKKKLLDYSNVLAGNPDYSIEKKEDDSLEVAAAHERTDIEVTDEMRKHDDDIMDDDDF